MMVVFSPPINCEDVGLEFAPQFARIAPNKFSKGSCWRRRVASDLTLCFCVSALNIFTMPFMVQIHPSFEGGEFRHPTNSKFWKNDFISSKCFMSGDVDVIFVECGLPLRRSAVSLFTASNNLSMFDITSAVIVASADNSPEN